MTKHFPISTAHACEPVANDPRWARVVARDRSVDGKFWYSVATTGIYCRPSCPSRAANPKNVQIHTTLAQARATGFRPCKRCNPDGPSAEQEYASIVAHACRRIELGDGELSLAGLARGSGLSAGHFHRIFKTVTGVTPKHYASARRAARLREGLSRSNTPSRRRSMMQASIPAGGSTPSRPTCSA